MPFPKSDIYRTLAGLLISGSKKIQRGLLPPSLKEEKLQQIIWQGCRGLEGENTQLSPKANIQGSTCPSKQRCHGPFNKSMERHIWHSREVMLNSIPRMREASELFVLNGGGLRGRQRQIITLVYNMGKHDQSWWTIDCVYRKIKTTYTRGGWGSGMHTRPKGYRVSRASRS